MLLLTAAHSDGSSVGRRSERESSQRSQDGDEHKLRGDENHVGKLELKQSKQDATSRKDKMIGFG